MIGIFRENNVRIQAVLAAMSATIFFGLLQSIAPAVAQSGLHDRQPKTLPPQVFDMQPYDDVFEIESEELTNYLNFEGSKFNPIVRIKIKCFCKTNVDHGAQPIKYQDLWLRGGDVIGLKQYAPMPCEENDRVAILIKPRFKPYSETEIAGCSAALVRMRLALSLNKNLIDTVRVPGLTLDIFVAELRKQHFIPYKELRRHLDVLIPIPLESETGTKVVSCFVQEN